MVTLHLRVVDLQARAVKLQMRPVLVFRRNTYDVRWCRGEEDPAAYALKRLIAQRPLLVAVFSEGGPFPAEGGYHASRSRAGFQPDFVPQA
jgi:hypothetical protein